MADRTCSIDGCTNPHKAPPTCGQRPEDLARWVVENYPEMIAQVASERV